MEPWREEGARSCRPGGGVVDQGEGPQNLGWGTPGEEDEEDLERGLSGGGTFVDNERFELVTCSFE